MKPWLGKSSWSTARGAGIKTCVSLFGAKGFSGCGFRALGVQGLAFGVAGTAKFEQEASVGNLNPKTQSELVSFTGASGCGSRRHQGANSGTRCKAAVRKSQAAGRQSPPTTYSIV